MEKKKKNNSNVDLEKSIERLENRLDCFMCSISGDMADVLTRVHKLEDNHANDINEKAEKEKKDDEFCNKFVYPLAHFALCGLMFLGFSGVVISMIRDLILSVIGA